MPRSSTARRLGIAAVCLLLLAVLAAGAEAVRIHHHDGQWALVPTVAPERLTVAGRDYRRGNRVHEAEGDVVSRGTTSGGGTILVPADDPRTPTIVWVRKADRVWEYVLLGGP